MKKLQPEPVQKQIEINQLNQLIGDFDKTLKYFPVKAGYSPHHYTSIDKKFNTWKECFDFCDKENKRKKNPDDCYFALPKRQYLQFDYHSNWASLMPVVEQINIDLFGRVRISETSLDGYGWHASFSIFGKHATWYQIYYADYKRLTDELEAIKKEMERLGDVWKEDEGYGRIVADSKILAVWQCVVKAMLYLQKERNECAGCGRHKNHCVCP